MAGRRRVRVLGRALELANLDKVMYPAGAITKAHVLDYYRRVAPAMLPHLRLRPVTLVRHPDGVGGPSFFEKRCPDHRPDWVATATVRGIRSCTVNDLATLMWTANLASLELHVLLSRAVAPDRPTVVAFDLDPGEPAGLLDAAAIGLILRRVLEGIGLASFAKVSGGKGLHCYVPLNTPVTFDQTKEFARTVAERMERHWPDRVVSRMRKALRPGKVLIDWSQNDAHKTTVCAYSLRAAERPSVSAPVAWDEVEAAVEEGDEARLRLTPERVLERLEAGGDGFAPVLARRQRLPGAAKVELEPPAVLPEREDPPPRRGARQTARERPELAQYAAKRRRSTPEPSGREAPLDELIGTFVVQQHAARSLHWDLRLESGGVLRSWAVPKGPSLDPEERRLAVQVEDHPLGYARFEGVIPAGRYGAGQVIVWDRGPFTVISAKAGRPATVEEGLASGHFEVRLQGVKLQGRFLLVRTGGGDGEPAQWLLTKRRDETAWPAADPLANEPYSVLTGLWIDDLAAGG